MCALFHRTCLKQVMSRAGVSRTSPEGVRWTAVSTPPGCEVLSISCGCTGLVWAVLFNGRALIRGGVTGITPTGQCAPPNILVRCKKVLASPNLAIFLYNKDLFHITFIPIIS